MKTVKKLIEHTVALIAETGKSVNPRHKATKECQAVTLTLNETLLLDAISKTQILCENSQRLFEHLTEYYRDYSRVFKQLDYVFLCFKEDERTRQAVISMWSLNDPKPCITQLQFLIRNDQLHMYVYLRSSDAINRLEGDIYFLTSILMLVSKILHIELGSLEIFAASLHYYLDDID